VRGHGTEYKIVLTGFVRRVASARQLCPTGPVERQLSNPTAIVDLIIDEGHV